MEQKHVSFEMAKALKEAGYLQPLTGFGYATKQQVIEFCKFNEGDLFDLEEFFPEPDNYVYCPTYIDVWLWLWNTKNIQIEVADKSYFAKAKVMGKFFVETNPEEAIAKAIDFLVVNNLIK